MLAYTSSIDKDKLSNVSKSIGPCELAKIGKTIAS